MSVVLNTEEYIPTQVESVRKEIDTILDDFMAPLVQQTIIAEIKALAIAANIPKGFIDGVKFIKTGKNTGKVVNTWGTPETPLAKYFNYGTTQHWIEPKEKEALKFPNTSGRNATAIYFQGQSNPTGFSFSKGHYISGVPRTDVMERGFQIGKKRMAEEAAKIVERELRYE